MCKVVVKTWWVEDKGTHACLGNGIDPDGDSSDNGRDFIGSFTLGIRRTCMLDSQMVRSLHRAKKQSLRLWLTLSAGEK